MNILEAGIKVSGTGYVASPGFNASGHYERIPPDAFTIAVNRAVEAPITLDLWLMMDIQVGECPWYYRGLEIAGDRLCVSREFNESVNSGVEAPYWFDVAPKLRGPAESVPLGDGVTPGYLRGGATTSAGAVQLLYQLGAREKIVLCGVDCEGNKYFTGEEMPYEVTYWPIIQTRFMALIGWLNDQGVEVTSLSETALNVPREL